MTGPRGRHPEYEELISASLAGDLAARSGGASTRTSTRATPAAPRWRPSPTAADRGRPAPRASLRATSNARVRTGIERGRFGCCHGTVDRHRCSPASAAACRGRGSAARHRPQLPTDVRRSATPPRLPTPTDAPRQPGTLTASFPPGPTPTPADADPSRRAGTPTPTSRSRHHPHPDALPRAHRPLRQPRPRWRTGRPARTIAEDSTAPGPPIAAELSPDGQWLAYIVRSARAGCTRCGPREIGDRSDADPDGRRPIDSPVAVGETSSSARAVPADPFLERCSGRATRLDPHLHARRSGGGGTDVWMLDVSETGELAPADRRGNAYAAAWVPGDADTWNLCGSAWPGANRPAISSPSTSRSAPTSTRSIPPRPGDGTAGRGLPAAPQPERDARHLLAGRHGARRATSGCSSRAGRRTCPSTTRPTARCAATAACSATSPSGVTPSDRQRSAGARTATPTRSGMRSGPASRRARAASTPTHVACTSAAPPIPAA
jgi:hypothetical protein